MKEILKKLVFTMVVILAMSSCRNNENTPSNEEPSPEDNIKIPQISSTIAVTEIGLNSAQSGGKILNDGGSKITSKGIVWDKNPNPTISLNTKTEDGSDMGDFTSKLTNLEGGIKYYLRAYATNSKGTAYGNELTIQLQNVYIAGFVGAHTQSRKACLWINGKLMLLPTTSTNSEATAVEVSENGDIYVSGNEYNIIGGWATLCVWKNGQKIYSLPYYKANTIHLDGNDWYASCEDSAPSSPYNKAKYIKNGQLMEMPSVSNYMFRTKFATNKSGNLYLVGENLPNSLISGFFYKNNELKYLTQYEARQYKVNNVFYKDNNIYTIGNGSWIDSNYNCIYIFKNGTHYKSTQTLPRDYFSEGISFFIDEFNNEYTYLIKRYMNNTESVFYTINNQEYPSLPPQSIGIGNTSIYAYKNKLYIVGGRSYQPKVFIHGNTAEESLPTDNQQYSIAYSIFVK